MSLRSILSHRSILSYEKVAAAVSQLTMLERMQLEKSASSYYQDGGDVLSGHILHVAEKLDFTYKSTNRLRPIVCNFFCGEYFILAKRRL